MLPNFVIAGATRSGTTSLYYYLKQHPEIDFPSLKEPRYFSSIRLNLPQNGPGDYSVDKKLVLSLDQYKNLYKNINNKIVGDASSEYLYHHNETALRIRELLGDVPILIILRNPIERVYSAYHNLIRDGRENENFEIALKLEAERKKNNFDMMWIYKDVSLYACQVKTFIYTFSKVKILIFEEFIDNPQFYLEEIYKFLGVNNKFTADIKIKYSKSGQPKIKLITMLFGRNSKYTTKLRNIILKLIPRKTIENIISPLLKKSDMRLETRKYLRNYFKSDIAELEILLKKELSFWK